METAIQRLSSGLRINSAKDDTAGSAISQRMQNQIRGQRMASNNIKQGTNLVQTAEGGLGEIQGILSRMRELAVQAASDNLNARDRHSIDLEYQQLKQEVDRISGSTIYNQHKLLQSSNVSSSASGGLITLEPIQGEWVQGNVPTESNNLAKGRPAKANSHEMSPASSMSAVDGDEFSRWSSNRNDPGPDQNNPHSIMVDLEEMIDISSIVLNIGGSDNHKQNFGLFVSADGNNWQQITNETDVTGTLTYDTSAHTAQYVRFESYYSADDGQVNVYEIQVFGESASLSGSSGGSINSGEFTLQIGEGPTVEDRLTFEIDSVTIESMSLSETHVSTLQDSQTTINSLNAAIDFINDQRSNLGAVQNRLGCANSNLMSSIQILNLLSLLSVTLILPLNPVTWPACKY
jgi:flagellin